MLSINCFNRTLVELKYKTLADTEGAKGGFNRTLVELKSIREKLVVVAMLF